MRGKQEGRERQQGYRSYLLRLWRVKVKQRAIWRASLECPNSGERKGFADLETLCRYLRDVTDQEGGDDRKLEAGSAYPVPTHNPKKEVFVMTRSTEQVFEDHKNAILSGDFPKLIADYANDAVLMTMDGAFVGQEAIQGFFQNIFAANPNVRIDFRQVVVKDDMLLLEWAAESDTAVIAPGVDTFIIRDDKIRRQTMWFIATPKEA
jgi:hypothetical protein